MCVCVCVCECDCAESALLSADFIFTLLRVIRLYFVDVIQ